MNVSKKLALADIFAEESQNETFYGFSDSENVDQGSDVEDEARPDLKAESNAFPEVHSFRLRVALRSSTRQHSEEEEEEEEERMKKRGMKRGGGHGSQKKKKKMKRHVRFEDEDPAAVSPCEERASDSGEDVSVSFLSKREQNIKANRAMLAQLMADLQNMPGGAGLLKKQQKQQNKTKDRSSRPPPPPRSEESSSRRRNPERATRRHTRSMGSCEEPSVKEEELELSLEELLEVRRAPPRRRGPPRPNQSRPHSVRPVEDVTEDELRMVAENMTDKVYDRVTGSTCHQCRQKTVDTKTSCRGAACRGIQGQFCGPCLRNRYGEDVRNALLDPDWTCPPCRGICNCSFCRQRDGRCPTGILFPLAQHHGFNDVHSYLSSLRNKLKDED